MAVGVLARAAGAIDSLAGGGMLPPSGIGGDRTGQVDMLRRMLEQGAIDGTGYLPSWSLGISENRVRGIIPIAAGVRLLAGICMQMPLVQYRGDQLVDPPAGIVLNPAPQDNGTLASFVDGYVGDVAYYGNHLSILGDLDSTGWPAWLLPVDITRVQVARDDTGGLVYTYDGDTDTALGSSEVLHVAIDRRSGFLSGSGLFPFMSPSLGAIIAGEEYAGRYFDESAIPTGVITDNRPDLTQDQADKLKEAWLRTVGGRRRVPIVLPATTTFTPLVSDADKAQLVEARQWNAQLAAMALGIPPFLLGVATDPHTYTNSENEIGRLINTTIMRLIRPLEQSFSLQCIPRGNVARFNTAELLRPETKDRATTASGLYTAGVITLPEARTFAGWPAEGGPTHPPAEPGPPAIESDPVPALPAAV
jgi:HK97 family phage portal protein